MSGLIRKAKDLAAKIVVVDHERVADRFAVLLLTGGYKGTNVRPAMTPAVFAAELHRRQQTYASQYPSGGVCAAHDFYDANMIWDEAFQDVSDLDPMGFIEKVEEDEPTEIVLNALVDVLNAAGEHLHARGFLSYQTAVEAVWTPWAEILCWPCHGAQRTTTTQTHHADGTVDPPVTKTRTFGDYMAEPREGREHEGLAVCDKCGADVWMEEGIAACSRLVELFAGDDRVEAAMEQTGGMCWGLGVYDVRNGPAGDCKRYATVTNMNYDDGWFACGIYNEHEFEDDSATEVQGPAAVHAWVMEHLLGEVA